MRNQETHTKIHFELQWGTLYERMPSRIVGNLAICPNNYFGLTAKKGSNFALLALCEGNPPVTGGFPSKRTSNAHSVRISSWFPGKKYRLWYETMFSQSRERFPTPVNQAVGVRCDRRWQIRGSGLRSNGTELIILTSPGVWNLGTHVYIN